MNEDQAPYLEKADPPQFFPSDPPYSHWDDVVRYSKLSGRVSLDKGDFLVASVESDPFGAKAVFNAHYDLSIENMHPIQAVKAAYAAALAYAESYDYINLSSKGSDIPEYRMVPKREGKSKSV